MDTKRQFSITLLLTGLLAGCGTTSFLAQRTDSERAEFGNTPIVVSAHLDSEPEGRAGGPGSNVNPVPDRPGTWNFTAPRNVTQVERKGGNLDQFSLYNGRPGPSDTPFVLITISRDRKTAVEAEPATYKISDTREYVMNGLVAKEWTGLTDTGAGFCELLVRRPGTAGETGDFCHAIAVVKTEEERGVALSILGSIVWQDK
ncbi:MAG TPA: hypothetical protein VGN88_07660 [Phycisphaerae bacterium]|jgi:hypothetical protein